MPKVSVIIPCYNLGKYLEEAVESVIAQTFQDFEIIIVNDGSTDEFTNNLLANYNKPKTRVLTTENQGLPSARNNGIRIAQGEYVCCLDADDRFHPQFLEKTVPILDNDYDHKVGIVTTWVQLFGKDNSVWKLVDFAPYRLGVQNLLHVASLYRLECWKAKGGYSTNLTGYQDWDFWLALIALGYTWVTVKEPLFYYRVRPDSMVKGSNKKRLDLYSIIIDNNREYFDNNNKEILMCFQEQLMESNTKISNISKTDNKDDKVKLGKFKQLLEGITKKLQ